MDNDIGAAFDKLDRLLEVAQDAGPSIALLMEAGRQQGLGDQTVQKYLKLNTTVLRWCLKLSPDATADRSSAELVDVGALLIEWARR
jgi:tRNA A37 threonylcarbamoyltransferase TsaD